MDTQFFYYLKPLHCGGIHLSDEMIVNLVLLSVASLMVVGLAWASSRRASDSGE